MKAISRAKVVRSGLASLSLVAIALALAAGPSNTANAAQAQQQIQPVFEREPMPKAGSPNFIYIVLDDTGFADLGCYGSEISTPAMDMLGKQGVRFNNFHTRAICSPTRAALLTGRNSHSVGVANVTNMLSGYSHGQGRITPAAATIAELLENKGYRTFAVGKWHLSPMQLTSGRDHWPLARGFDQFYGFLDGMTDQYYPDMVVDNTPISLNPGKDYHLSADLVDKAISYVSSSKGSEPERPFFLYLAFGATHAPHQVPQSYIDKYLSIYAAGWDEIRTRRFVRQKELGIIPADAELAPRNPDVVAWSTLTPEQKSVNTRFQAAYAGFLEHTDEQIGRVLEFLRESGELDNTVIVLISDNGGSVEGHQSGTLNEVRSLNQVKETTPELYAGMNKIGSKLTYPNYPSGWAQVSSTPFQYYKTTLWDGGTRDPLIIYSQSEVRKPGKVRTQFVDVIDITPTILDIAGIEAPETYRGVAQMPLHGASIRAVLASEKASSPRDTQYFELLGQRAIWQAGWQAISEHKVGEPFEQDVWHLYNMKEDFSGLRDVSKQHPAKLAELKAVWDAQAEKYGVLPMMNAPLLGSFSSGPLAGPVVKYKTMRDPRGQYVFYPRGTNLLRMDAPQIGTGSFRIRADLALKVDRPSGVLIADGDRFGGYTLFALNGVVKFQVSDLGTSNGVTATQSLARSVKQVTLAFDRVDSKGGIATIFYDGREVGSGRIERRETQLTAVAGFSVGFDTSGPVSDAYGADGGFPFPEGQIKRISVERIVAPK